jgi:aminoglycoside phosphotransferase (APT) family kinase protein
MSVSDRELRPVLERAWGRAVPTVRRQPWEYTSSTPIEVLEADGCPPLLFKNLSERGSSAPAALVDPGREIEVYARFGPGLDAPDCVAAVCRPGRAWLFLERVDGVPLWQSADDGAWLAAARYLARLHRVPAPARTGRLLICGSTHLDAVIDRALATPGLSVPRQVASAARRAVRVLSGGPASLLHGEFYPANVLVQSTPVGARVRPVDWEMAGIGPGVLDLAALISGDHEPRLRDLMVTAYRDELGAEPETLSATLAAARLLIAMQWLGWDAGWTPPPEHAHDWAREAQALVSGAAP